MGHRFSLVGRRFSWGVQLMTASQVRSAVEAAFRNFALDGVPSSGPNEPDKAEIRYALGQLLETTLSSIGTGLLRYQTKAAMDADTGQNDGQLAYVWNDSTGANNKFYQWDDGGNAWDSADWYFSAVQSAIEAGLPAAEVSATLLPFKTLPPAASGLNRLMSLKLLPSAAEALPSDPLFVKYLFRDMSGTRLQAVIQSWDGSTGTNRIGLSASIGALNPTTFDDDTGLVELDAKAASGTAFPGFANGAAIGKLVIDLRDGTDFSGTYAFADAELEPSRIQASAGEQAIIEELVQDSITNGPTRSPALVSTVTDQFLHDVIKSVTILGENVEHEFGFNYIERTSVRYRFRVRDFTAGYDVALGGKTDSGGIDYENEWPYVLCHLVNPLTIYSGVMVFLEVDWSKFTLGSDKIYSTYAEGGIVPAAICPSEEQYNFIVHKSAARRISVAPGDETLQDAINEILDPDSPHLSTDPNFSLSPFANPRRVPVFQLEDGDYGCRNTAFPQFVHVKGTGRSRVINFGTPGVGNAGHITQAPYSGWWEDIEFYTDAAGSAYAVHIDEAGSRLRSDQNPESGGVQNFRSYQRFDRCRFTAGPTATSAAMGLGIGSGQHLVINTGSFRSLSYADPLSGIRPALSSHNTKAAALPCVLELIDCQHEDAVQKGLGGAWFFQNLCSGQRNSLIVRGGNGFLGLIIGDWIADGTYEDLAEDLVLETVVSGSPNMPFAYTDNRATVLAFPIGATVSESTPLLVKGLYPWGYGKACVSDLQSYTGTSLGQRLGDEPTYSLIVNGVTWTANNSHNYTADSNATIIAEMNATLGAGVVTLANLANFFYPDIGHKRDVRNGSGAGFTRAHKGYALTYIDGDDTTPARGRVRLADGDDRVDGWLLTPGDDGEYLQMIAADAVSSVYVAGATVDGPFRIVSGVPTFTGVTVDNQKGRVISARGQSFGGVVELFR